MPRDWISVSLDFYCDRGYSPRSFADVADARRPKPFSIEREIAMSVRRVPSVLASLLAGLALTAAPLTLETGRLPAGDGAPLPQNRNRGGERRRQRDRQN